MIGRLVVLLLAANLGWLAWSQGWLRPLGLAPRLQAEPERLQRQVQPEAIRLRPLERARQQIAQLQDGQRALCRVGGNEEVVVIGGRHDIAADAGLGQGAADGSGESHGLQVAVHVEGDPGQLRRSLQLGCFGDLGVEDNSAALVLEEGHDRAPLGLDRFVFRQGEEDIATWSQPRSKTGEESVEVGDGGHGCPP